MTTRMALKVRVDVHNDLLLLMITFYSTEASIYLHLPLGSHSFLSIGNRTTSSTIRD